MEEQVLFNATPGLIALSLSDRQKRLSEFIINSKYVPDEYKAQHIEKLRMDSLLKANTASPITEGHVQQEEGNPLITDNNRILNWVRAKSPDVYHQANQIAMRYSSDPLQQNKQIRRLLAASGYDVDRARQEYQDSRDKIGNTIKENFMDTMRSIQIDIEAAQIFATPRKPGTPMTPAQLKKIEALRKERDHISLAAMERENNSFLQARAEGLSGLIGSQAGYFNNPAMRTTALASIGTSLTWAAVSAGPDPSDAITVPALVGAGIKRGMVLSSALQGAGNILMESMDDGKTPEELYNLKTLGKITPFALTYAALEDLELSTIQALGATGGAKEFIKNMAINVGTNVAQEMGQEASVIAGKSWIMGEDPFTAENFARIADEIKTAPDFAAMAFLGLPATRAQRLRAINNIQQGTGLTENQAAAIYDTVINSEIQANPAFVHDTENMDTAGETTLDEAGNIRSIVNLAAPIHSSQQELARTYAEEASHIAQFERGDLSTRQGQMQRAAIENIKTELGDTKEFLEQERIQQKALAESKQGMTAEEQATLAKDLAAMDLIGKMANARLKETRHITIENIARRTFRSIKDKLAGRNLRDTYQFIEELRRPAEGTPKGGAIALFRQEEDIKKIISDQRKSTRVTLLGGDARILRTYHRAVADLRKNNPVALKNILEKDLPLIKNEKGLVDEWSTIRRHIGEKITETDKKLYQLIKDRIKTGVFVHEHSLRGLTEKANQVIKKEFGIGDSSKAILMSPDVLESISTPKAEAAEVSAFSDIFAVDINNDQEVMDYVMELTGLEPEDITDDQLQKAKEIIRQEQEQVDAETAQEEAPLGVNKFDNIWEYVKNNTDNYKILSLAATIEQIGWDNSSAQEFKVWAGRNLGITTPRYISLFRRDEARRALNNHIAEIEKRVRAEQKERDAKNNELAEKLKNMTPEEAERIGEEGIQEYLESLPEHMREDVKRVIEAEANNNEIISEDRLGNQVTETIEDISLAEQQEAERDILAETIAKDIDSLSPNDSFETKLDSVYHYLDKNLSEIQALNRTIELNERMLNDKYLTALRDKHNIRNDLEKSVKAREALIAKTKEQIQKLRNKLVDTKELTKEQKKDINVLLKVSKIYQSEISKKDKKITQLRNAIERENNRKRERNRRIARGKIIKNIISRIKKAGQRFSNRLIDAQARQKLEEAYTFVFQPSGVTETLDYRNTKTHWKEMLETLSDEALQDYNVRLNAIYAEGKVRQARKNALNARINKAIISEINDTLQDRKKFWLFDQQSQEDTDIATMSLGFLDNRLSPELKNFINAARREIRAKGVGGYLRDWVLNVTPKQHISQMLDYRGYMEDAFYNYFMKPNSQIADMKTQLRSDFYGKHLQPFLRTAEAKKIHHIAGRAFTFDQLINLGAYLQEETARAKLFKNNGTDHAFTKSVLGKNWISNEQLVAVEEYINNNETIKNVSLGMIETLAKYKDAVSKVADEHNFLFRQVDNWAPYHQVRTHRLNFTPDSGYGLVRENVANSHIVNERRVGNGAIDWYNSTVTSVFDEGVNIQSRFIGYAPVAKNFFTVLAGIQPALMGESQDDKVYRSWQRFGIDTFNGDRASFDSGLDRFFSGLRNKVYATALVFNPRSAIKQFGSILNAEAMYMAKGGASLIKDVVKEIPGILRETIASEFSKENNGYNRTLTAQEKTSGVLRSRFLNGNSNIFFDLTVARLGSGEMARKWNSFNEFGLKPLVAFDRATVSAIAKVLARRGESQQQIDLLISQTQNMTGDIYSSDLMRKGGGWGSIMKTVLMYSSQQFQQYGIMMALWNTLKQRPKDVPLTGLIWGLVCLLLGTFSFERTVNSVVRVDPRNPFKAQSKSMAKTPVQEFAWGVVGQAVDPMTAQLISSVMYGGGFNPLPWQALNDTVSIAYQASIGNPKASADAAIKSLIRWTGGNPALYTDALKIIKMLSD